MRTASVTRIDRQRRAGVAEAGHHPALTPLALRACALGRRLRRYVVERIAERAATPHRQRAGRIGFDDTGDQDGKSGKARRKTRGTHDRFPR